MLSIPEIRSLLDTIVVFDDLPLEARVYQLALWGCEIREMAAEAVMSEDNLIEIYGQYVLRGHVSGLIDLRKQQHYTAVCDRNPAMLKHLGAHRLAQIDELIQKFDIQDKLSKQEDLKTLSKEELLAKIAAFVAPASVSKSKESDE